jgi:hypothetical protein
MNLSTLMRHYRTDPVSNYAKLEYCTRRYYDRLMAHILRTVGDPEIAEIKGRTVHLWHQQWTDDGHKVSIGHALVGMMRTLVNFGFFALDDADCERAATILSKGRFANGKPRTVRITRDQVLAIANFARPMAPMLALAQVLQFEFSWRQKDVIGEWVPVSEPGLSDIHRVTKKGPLKWIKGVRWEEIDADGLVHHVTSKRKKLSEPTLAYAPLTCAEIDRMFPEGRPKFGPIILYQDTGLPYDADKFREHWRAAAIAVGVPLNVQNRDSRAGGISEAIQLGCPVEHVRDMATHSDVSQTYDYSRANRENTHEVMRLRMEKNKVARCS